MVEAKFNIYKAYTDNIGNITSMIADELKLDEDEYGAAMVIEAIKVAAFANARNIKYIEAVLRNSKKSLRPDRNSLEARLRYGDWETK